ncbi:TatD family hydrolase [Dokdonella sp. MW10]|uniref:TatD family hydrolase n=1 Tax=Dokdonella sp. MW10 TaxID=2992926 RepID=UPI003F7E4B5E
MTSTERFEPGDDGRPPHPRLVDTHSHFDVSAFDDDRDAALARAREAGVTRQIVPAIAAAGWPALRDLCAAHAGLFPAYGLHPLFLAEHADRHLEDLERWIADEKPVAVGECGLDFHVEGLDADVQRRLLDRQLRIARDAGLPVILHARRAFDEIGLAIRRVGSLSGVVHSFSGSTEQAKRLCDLGFCLGIGGPVTYPRATRLRGIVATLPIAHLLLETDSPDQPLCGHQGARNEPARLVEVLEVIATLRDMPAAELAAATTRNAERVFGLPREA